MFKCTYRTLDHCPCIGKNVQYLIVSIKKTKLLKICPKRKKNNNWKRNKKREPSWTIHRNVSRFTSFSAMRTVCVYIINTCAAKFSWKKKYTRHYLVYILIKTNIILESVFKVRSKVRAHAVTFEHESFVLLFWAHKIWHACKLFGNRTIFFSFGDKKSQPPEKIQNGCEQEIDCISITVKNDELTLIDTNISGRNGIWQMTPGSNCLMNCEETWILKHCSKDGYLPWICLTE